MRNFGEELTYWYLRLNGFLPLPNFVLHRYDGRHNADTDLLALRLPYTYERVGGQIDHLDDRFRLPWAQDSEGMALPNRTVGLVVQVKTGDVTPGSLQEDLNRAFTRDRLLASVWRLGVVPEQVAEHRLHDLERQRLVEFHEHRTTLAKVLVTERPLQVDGYYCWDLLQMSTFIISRFEQLRDKDGGRLFFPGDLVQYLSWIGERNRDHR